MARGADDAHLDAALKPALLMWEASKLDKMLPTRLEGEPADEADAAAAAAATACPLAAPSPIDVTVAACLPLRHERLPPRDDAPPLLDLLQSTSLPEPVAVEGSAEPARPPMLALVEDFPDLFKKEVLERLEPTDRTMLAQAGRPWLAAVLASGLPRLPKGVRVWLRLMEFCTSVERLAWAKANGCPWAGAYTLPLLSSS